ncbi:MAG: N-acetylmuramic acid 6-phosphate etherase [Oscillospiraceae bacterium]|nr:N-acetylmuramic acid 6-phosphate etherase [Oscillospiraceae bacterium]MBR2890003.1 N-acetylmuramic acid 6-phosphate etherase [Oscillospiraceae bacterium]
MVELKKIATEQRNPNTMNIDTLSTLDMVKLINQEDHRVAEAVAEVTDKIAQAIDVIADRLAKGGRLIYCGAGTSGRLGILDAVECPPTYSTEPEMVQALMAGGYPAIFKAVEGAEDSKELGIQDMKNISFAAGDVLVGIAASGRTPYVLGCMEYAKELGAPTVSVTCCPGSVLDSFADIGIAPCPGPEVITGSTRMKSGTAQKMVLNMLSTGSMIKLGKVYGNLMVDVKPSNEKLIRRCVTIVCNATGCDDAAATAALEACGYRPKTAIIMVLCGVGAEEAVAMLDKADGRVAKVLEK